MLIVGTAQGPLNHWWYWWLDRYLPGRKITTIGKKILADQLIASPLGSGSFFLGLGLLEGKTLLQSWEEFSNKFIMVYLVIFFIYYSLFSLTKISLKLIFFKILDGLGCLATCSAD